MRNARSWTVTAVLCALVGLASVLLASAPANADDAPKTSKSDIYRLVTVMTVSGDQWDFYRINTDTGDVWTPDTTTSAWVWLKMVDSDKLPSGDYDLQVINTGSGNSATENVFRIERKTGQTWHLVGTNFVLIAEPK